MDVCARSLAQLLSHLQCICLPQHPIFIQCVTDKLTSKCFHAAAQTVNVWYKCISSPLAFPLLLRWSRFSHTYRDATALTDYLQLNGSSTLVFLTNCYMHLWATLLGSPWFYQVGPALSRFWGLWRLIEYHYTNDTFHVETKFWFEHLNAALEMETHQTRHNIFFLFCTSLRDYASEFCSQHTVYSTLSSEAVPL